VAAPPSKRESENVKALPMTNNESPIRICFTVDAAYAGGAEKYVSAPRNGDRQGNVRTGRVGENEPAARRLVRPALRVRREGCPRADGSPLSPARCLPDLEGVAKGGPHAVHINMPGPSTDRWVFSRRSQGGGEHRGRRDGTSASRGAPVEKGVGEASVVFVRRSGAHGEPFQSRVPGRTARGPRIQDAVVYNGIPEVYGSRRGEWRDVARGSLGLGSADAGIVFVGSLVERKGMRILLDALGPLAGVVGVSS